MRGKAEISSYECGRGRDIRHEKIKMERPETVGVTSVIKSEKPISHENHSQGHMGHKQAIHIPFGVSWNLEENILDVVREAEPLEKWYHSVSLPSAEMK